MGLSPTGKSRLCTAHAEDGRAEPFLARIQKHFDAVWRAARFTGVCLGPDPDKLLKGDWQGAHAHSEDDGFVERENEYEITAQLSGMDNNVELMLADGLLTIKGIPRLMCGPKG